MYVLVLDTNVVLDLFVFRDSRVRAIREALTDGSAIWLVDEECRREFERVLTYTKLALPQECQKKILSDFDKLSKVVAHPVIDSVPGLPRCRDPDDQKFLHLAVCFDADLLITKDSALLDLATRLHRPRIASPRTACALIEGGPAHTTAT